MRSKLASLFLGLYIGLILFVSLSSDKQLPLILLAIALLSIIALYWSNVRKSGGAHQMAMVSVTLLSLVPVAFFSPIDLRIRRDGLVGVRFLPVTYSIEKLSSDDVDRAIQDPETLLRQVDPKNEVRIYRSPILNRAYYSIVVDFP